MYHQSRMDDTCISSGAPTPCISLRVDARLRVFAHSYPGSILQDEDAFFHPNQRGGGR
ncbi:hypothetical protein PISMIDRAFT_563222 [Pisolithus microcarpus 441]|uniref:Uncharacterized protein n=1 Tax=Pisolithus microcarpus 441 TaxID=765257 RepID=A0A0C9YWM4_9AGAM|nr:hypothetical protein PISMIDRAFT_563222 [Pisolithus microcarpus 441]